MQQPSARGVDLISAATVQYNGVLIDEIIKSKVTSVPVYNSQGTAVKYVEHTIELEAIVHPNMLYPDWTAPDGSADNALEVIRQRLLVTGGELIYEDKGFGREFNIVSYQGGNASAPSDDVDFGPKPKMMMFETMGCNIAARINWSCTVRVIEACETHSGLTEYWCTSDLKINNEGHQILTRNGYMEAAAGVLNDGTLTVRMSREYIALIAEITALDGMSKYQVEHHFNFTPDDKACTFTITYTEIPSPSVYPQRVTKIKAIHTQSSKLLGKNPFEVGFKTWKNTLTANITLRPGVAKHHAYTLFMIVALQKLQEGLQIPLPRDPDFDRIRVPIPLSMKVTDDIFSYNTQFQFEWSSSGRSIFEAFNSSGIFKLVDQSIPGWNTWQEWEADIRQACQNQVGYAPLSDLGNTIKVVTPCTDGPANVAPSAPLINEPIGTFGIWEPTPPPPEASYIDYHNEYAVLGETSRSVHTPYRESYEIERRQYEEGITPEEDVIILDNNYNPQDDTPVGNQPSHSIQDFGNDYMHLRMSGYSARIGYPTTAPRVKSIGDREVMLVHDDVEDSTVQPYKDFPIFMTRWTKVYRILGTPEGNMYEKIETTGRPGAH